MCKAEIVKKGKEKERKAALLGCIFAVPMTEALAAAGVRRATYIRWLKEDSEFRDAVAQAKELQVDEVETKAFSMAKSGVDGAMTRFMLKAHRDIYKDVDPNAGRGTDRLDDHITAIT